MARLAALQCLDVLFFESKAVQVRQVRWITEFSDGEKAREFAEFIDITRKFEVALRCSFYVYGPENKHFIGDGRVHEFGNRSAVLNLLNLVLAQSGVVLEEGLGFRTALRPARCAGNGDQCHQQE